MNCQRTKDLLKPLLEGKLHGDMLQQVRMHIASCADCRSGLSPQDVVEILPVFDDSIEPSDDFADRFYAELDRRRNYAVKQQISSRAGSSWVAGWSRGLAAAAAMVLLVVAGTYFRQSPYPAPDTSAVLYDLEVTENLAFFKDMGLYENLDLFEDLDAIENLPQLN
jgi:hypothetical protein